MRVKASPPAGTPSCSPGGSTEVGAEEKSVAHLLVQVAVLLDDPDPGQHVLAVLGLEQVLAVRGGQPQHVLALGVAVGDVDQTRPDADGKRLLQRLAVGLGRPLPLVLVQAEVVTSQHGVHLLPWAHDPAHPLQRPAMGEKRPSRGDGAVISGCLGSEVM